MKKNVSSQMVGVMMTYAASGTPITVSGAVLAYLVMDGGTMALGTAGSGVCVPRSYGYHYYVPPASETNFDHLAFTFVASGGVNITNQLYTEFPQTGDAFARLGVPVGASVSADVGSIQIGVNSLYARVGVGGAGLTTLATSGNLDNVYTRIGAAGVGLLSLASSGDLATANTNITSLHTRVNSVGVQVGSNTIAISSLHTRVSSVQVGADNIYARVGAPVGASLAADVGSIQVGVNSLYARVGTPVGASIAVDVSSIQTQANSIYGRIGVAGAGLTTLAASGDLSAANINITSLHTRVSSAAVQVDSTYARIGVAGAGLTTLATSGNLDNVFTRIGAGGVALTTLATSGDLANVFTRLGAPVGANFAADVSSIQTMTTSIYARVGAPVGASLAVDVSSIQTQVNSIYFQTNKLQFGGVNRVSVDVTAINSDATAAANMAKTTRALGRGTVTGSGPPTPGNLFMSSFTPVGVDAGQFRGRIVTFDADTLTTALRGQSTDVLSSSAAAAPLFGVSSLTTAPVSGDTLSLS